MAWTEHTSDPTYHYSFWDGTDYFTADIERPEESCHWHWEILYSRKCLVGEKKDFTLNLDNEMKFIDRYTGKAEDVAEAKQKAKEAFLIYFKHQMIEDEE